MSDSAYDNVAGPVGPARRRGESVPPRSGSRYKLAGLGIPSADATTSAAASTCLFGCGEGRQHERRAGGYGGLRRCEPNPASPAFTLWLCVAETEILTSSVSVAPPSSVTVRRMTTVDGVFWTGAANLGVAVFAPTSVTAGPDTRAQAYESIVPSVVRRARAV